IVALDDDLENNNVAIEVTDLIENLDQKRILWEKEDLIRHDPEKLADSICRIFAKLSLSSSERNLKHTYVQTHAPDIRPG
ncbi:MAG: hypothetical protein HOF76_20115, partial [Candidatus Scalindua sp.]|nr:hypothetical protein [Candidatus Scalindua sp.]